MIDEDMVLRTFICVGNPEAMKEWCEMNCQSKFIITDLRPEYGYGRRVNLVEVVLTHEDDAVLFRLAWESNEAKVAQTSTETVGEPAFTVEELQAQEYLQDTRQYVIGSTNHYYDGKNAAFVEEMREWIGKNLHHAVIIEPPMWDNMIVVGVPDEDDRVLFLMKWEGHPQVTLAQGVWAA